MNLTYDETMLMALYNTGTREGLIDALMEMRVCIGMDEKELLSITASVIDKLKNMTDTEFENLDLVPDFYEDETEVLDAG